MPTRNPTIGAEQQKCGSASSWQRDAAHPNALATPVRSLHFDPLVRALPKYSYSFFNAGITHPLPKEQVRYSPGIAHSEVHQASWQPRNAFAIHPEACEALAPITSANSLFHRLIPVSSFSLKIPLSGGILKESVKIAPAKSIATADNSSFQFAAPDVFTHCAWM